MVLTAGCLWIGIGVAVSKCSARGWNYNVVQGLTSLGAALICAGILAGKSVCTGSSGISGFGFLMCCLAGFANFYNYVELFCAIFQKLWMNRAFRESRKTRTSFSN